MSLRKKLISLALILVLGAGIVFASHNEIKPVPEKNTEVIEEESNLSSFSRADTIYVWYTDEALTDYINKAAVTFGEEQNLHVLPVLVEEEGYLEAVNTASLEENQMPDVFVVNHYFLEKAYLAGLAAEITDVEGILDTNHFPQVALDSVTYRNKYVAYPFTYETSALIYNETDLMEWARQQAVTLIATEGLDDEAIETITDEEKEQKAAEDPERLEALTEDFFLSALPATLEDILTFADTYDAPEGVETVMTWDVSDIFYNFWFAGDALGIGGPCGDDRTLVNVDNEKSFAALTAYSELNQFFSIDTDKVSYEAVVEDFLSGKTVFTVATSDIVAILQTAYESDELGFDFGVGKIPAASEGETGHSLSVTGCVAVNGYSEKKEVANRFAAYLTNTCAGDIYAMTGRPAANLYGNEENDFLGMFDQEYACSCPLPKLMEMENYWMQLEVLFARIWNGSDVAEELSEMQHLMNLELGIDS